MDWHDVVPSKPMQNGFVESCNGQMWKECLNEHPFGSLRDARSLVAAWRADVHQNRPHSSLASIASSDYVNRSKEGRNLGRANPNQRPL